MQKTISPCLSRSVGGDSLENQGRTKTLIHTQTLLEKLGGTGGI